MSNRINLNPFDISVVTAPTTYPVSVPEVKAYLRVDDSADDSLIAGWIIAATAALESETRRAFINTTFDEVYDRWPLGYCYSACLHRAPLVSVTSITYVDTNGASQVWSSTGYEVDATSEPGRIALAYGQTFPSTRDEQNTVTIRYISGYGTASDVPPLAKQYIYMWVQAAQCRRPLMDEEVTAMTRIGDLLRYGL